MIHLVVLMLVSAVAFAEAPNSYLRLEKDSKYAKVWFEIYQQEEEWICRSKDYDKFFAKKPPLAGWRDDQLKKLNSKAECEFSAAAARVEKGKTLWESHFCADNPDFKKLWQQLSERCQGAI